MQKRPRQWIGLATAALATTTTTFPPVSHAFVCGGGPASAIGAAAEADSILIPDAAVGGAGAGGARRRVRGSRRRRRHMPCCWQATSSSDLKRKNGRSGDDTPDKKPKERKSQKNKSKTNKSSNSQQKTTTHTFPKDSVVSRLKQASLRAAARVKAEEELTQKLKKQQSQKQRADPQFTRDLSDNDDIQHSMNHNKPKMASLRDLTAAIDAQLQAARQAGSALYNHNNHNGGGAARDSMTAVMQHNEEQQQQAAQEEEQPSSVVLPTALFAAPSRRQQLTTVHKHVAVVLSKPLQDDQVTVEYASRLQRLVRLLQPQCGSDNNYNQPDCYYELVVFVGDRHGTAVLADCDAGYTYFRHLCAAQQINLTGTSTTPTAAAAAADDGDTGEEQLTGDDSGDGGGGGVQFHLERSSVQEGALQKVAQHVQQHRLPAWLLEAQQLALQQPETKEAQAVASTAARRRHRVKLHIHFALVSTEYHLCILHDIHSRSPVNSPLAALERWSLPSSWSDNNKNVDVQLETSWTYEYAATVRIRSAQDPVKALAAACYQRAQSLIPVLENLRGVAANHEFFQRDNYRVLVQARRSLVRDMEHLYQQQPSLAAVRRTILPSGGGGGGSAAVHHKPMDVVLEGALLSLGRCLDLVRPAGLLTGSVPAQDFRLAFQLLEQTVAQISQGCDPDRPLPAADWGLLLLLPSQQQQAPSASSSKGKDTARSEGAKGDDEAAAHNGEDDETMLVDY